MYREFEDGVKEPWYMQL